MGVLIAIFIAGQKLNNALRFLDYHQSWKKMSCKKCGKDTFVLSGGNGSARAQRLVGLCKSCASDELSDIRREDQAAVRQVLQQASNWIKKNF
jgi:hypothetical protein